jgi:hypothetical protein
VISNKHLHEELQWLDSVCNKCQDDTTKALLKSNILVIKLLHNMRTNQALALTGSGIDLIPSKRATDEDA